MKPVVVDGPRMSDIAEPEESRWLRDLLLAQLAREREILGVHLWTHSPRRFFRNPLLLPLMETLCRKEIPLALQVSVTGLGGTRAEPGIEPTEDAFVHLRRLLETGLLGPHRVCLRLDPLQAWQGPAGLLSNSTRIHEVLSEAWRMGIRRVRVSRIAIAPYRAKILARARNRGLEGAPVPEAEIASDLRDWIRKGMEIRSCACDLLDEGIAPGGCFDFPWVTRRQREEPEKPVAPRSGCRCHVPEYVRLWKVPRRSTCSGGCLACYAQEHT
jgi:hypothetical protein